VVDLVAFTFDVEDKRASFAFDIANQVVVVGKLKFREELDLKWEVALGWHDTGHRSHTQRITEVSSSTNALLREVECERNVFLVNDADRLCVFASKEKRAEAQFA
jgi:hypothetical protein